MNEKTDCPILAIANHKGGVAKTTTSVNLAAEWGRCGINVLLIDLDPQHNASIHVGKTHPADLMYTASEWLTGDAEIAHRCIMHDTHLQNVSLISGSLNLQRTEDELREISPRPNEEVRSKLEKLRKMFDVVIIDTPPSLRTLTSNALSAASHIVVPLESGSMYGMYGMGDLVKHLNKIRRVNPDMDVVGALLVKHDERLKICQAIKISAEEAFGDIIPVHLPTSTVVGRAVIENSSVHSVDRSAKISRQFRDLAEYLATRIGIRDAANRMKNGAGASSSAAAA